MVNKLAMTTFSFLPQLGTTRYYGRNAEGTRVSVDLEADRTLTLEDVVRSVRSDFGITALELFQPHIGSTDRARIEQLRSELDAAEIEVINVSVSSFHIAEANPEWRKEDLHDIREWMRAARDLGSPNVRVNLNPTRIHEHGELLSLEGLIDTLLLLAGHASELGIHLVIENGCPLTTTQEGCQRIIERVYPHVGLVLDIGNFDPVRSRALGAFFGDEQSAEAISSAEVIPAVEALLPFAEVVHVKSFGFDPEGTPVIYDPQPVLQAIRSAGYANPLIVEYEKRTSDASWSDDLLRACESIRTVFATD